MQLQNINQNQVATVNDLRVIYNEFIAYIQTSEATKRVYTRQLKQYFNFLGINGISSPSRLDIQNYLKHLQDKGLKPTTVQNYLVALKQFYNFLEVEHNLPNIAKGLKAPKVSRTHKKDNLSIDQLKSIIEKIDTSNEVGARDNAIILLMVTGALRTIEVHRAKIEDLRNVNGQTVLYVQGKGHNEKDTPVNISPAIQQAINHYLSFRSKRTLKQTSPLFTSTSNNNRGEAITTRTLSGLIKKHFINVGINSPRITAHSLRHTAITEAYKEMKQAGTTDALAEVQRYARHQNPATSQIYIHEVEQLENTGARLVSNKIAKALNL